MHLLAEDDVGLVAVQPDPDGLEFNLEHPALLVSSASEPDQSGV